MGACGGDVGIERIGMGEPSSGRVAGIMRPGLILRRWRAKITAGPTAGDPTPITIGQTCVQFQVPKTRRQWPIIFIYGSSHTGAALDSTPDGKEGWLSYAVRHTRASFVMD
jgi:hypothetical protein